MYINKNKLSHFVINLKWMVGGQVSPIISLIIKNNNNNNDDDDDDNNNSLNGFQHQFLKWGHRKVLTSTVVFRLQNLCGEVQRILPMRTTSRQCRNEIVFITVRVRNNRTLYWNLAVIRIIGLSVKVRCSSDER